jgi:hypothetical protein
MAEVGICYKSSSEFFKGIFVAPTIQEGGAQWSKDFVEHLRTVHFSLAILSLGLIIVTSSQRDSVTKRAQGQLDQIIRVAETLRRGWLETLCNERKAKLGSPLAAADPERKQINEFFLTYVVPAHQDDGPNSEYVISNDCLIADSVPSKPEMAVYPMVPVGKKFTKLMPALVDAPTTLAEFITLWDELNRDPQVVVPTVLGNKILILDGAPPRPGIEFKLDRQGGGRTLPMAFYLMPRGEEWRDTTHTGVFGFRSPADEVIPVADFKHADLDGVSYLREQLPPENRLAWKGGPFAETFAELQEVTKGREAASFEVWHEALKAELNRSGDSLEAFGLKVPAQTTTLWGTALLLGVQFYFLIHLMELSQKLLLSDPGWEVAWVGVYRGRLARILFRASALLLPVGTVIVLGFKAILIGESKWLWLIPVIGIPTSIWLSVKTANHLPKPPSAPPPFAPGGMPPRSAAPDELSGI